MKQISFAILFLEFVFCCSLKTQAQQGNVLFFVAQADAYYSEYIVAKAALEAAGYTVDVRTATPNAAGMYMLPFGTDIAATANTLPGSSYAVFQQQFQNSFGAAWNAALNATPATVPVNGRIQDVPDMNNYTALVIAGGTGINEYRVDGSYSGHGTATASDVQAAAEKLNALALNALLQGKPVLAQCHGASLPVFWRIPGTVGTGAESLGFSLLKNNQAAGYPEPQTATTLAGLFVQFKPEDRVTVSSPHVSFNDDENGEYKVISSRDWYPQTVAHATRTLLNIIETYPVKSDAIRPVSVLILHGGAVNPGNCSYLNRSNDIPCNYGAGGNLPADYTNLQNLLLANSSKDEYNFTVSDLNLTGSLPYNDQVQESILNYLKSYDVVLFYKHWSTGVSNNLQNALVAYADQGGGVLALHHGLYNDIDGALNKNILANQLFGAESAMATWSANLTSYSLFSTNYGHFVSTFGLDLPAAQQAPGNWFSNQPLPPSNLTYSTYPNFPVYDEIYNNMSFVPGQTFGRGVNHINPLFSNDLTPAGQCHTAGFVKLFNSSGDHSVGRVCYMQAGERAESININHRYGQVVRNAVAWAAGEFYGGTPTVWTGAVNNVWSNAANWTAGVPHEKSNARVPLVTTMPTLATTELVRNITIDSGVVITNAGQLSIKGNLTLNGVMEGNGSSIMNGKLSQVIFGNGVIHNLTVQNAAGVSVHTGATLQITGSLHLTTGLFNTSNNLVLRSTASGTARVAPVTGSITGKVTVERYCQDRRAWRLMTAPLNSNGLSGDFSIKNTWQLYANIYGSSNQSGTLDGVTPGSTMLTYNVHTQSYTPVLNTQTTPLFNNAAAAGNNAFFCWVRGNRSITAGGGSSEVTFSAAGNLQTGNQVFSFNGRNVNDFMAFGNPYASPVDLNAVSNNGLTSSFYVWDPNLASYGAWVTMVNLGGGNWQTTPNANQQDRFLQSGQGFFVQAAAASGSLTFTESSKASTTYANVFRPPASSIKTLRLNLAVMDAYGHHKVTDGVLAMFDNTFNRGIGREDAAKLMNMEENLSIASNGKTFAVEGRPMPIETDTMVLQMDSLKERVGYQFEFSPSNFADVAMEALLTDRFVGETVQISLTQNSLYSFTTDSNQLSKAADRFIIVFKKKIPVPGERRRMVVVFPNPVQDRRVCFTLGNVAAGVYTAVVSDAAGRNILTKQFACNGDGAAVSVPMKTTVPAGMYQLRIHSGAFSHVESFMLSK